MSLPEIEDETRPCVYDPCPGTMEPELDGGSVVWSCGTCHNETYTMPDAAPPGTCGAGVQPDAQQRSPVFLGQALMRRPQ